MSRETLSIVHVVDRLDEAYGGPARAVPLQCREQALAGHDVSLLHRAPAAAADVGAVAREAAAAAEGLRVHRVVRPAELARRFADADVVHVHGLWDPLAARSCRVARSSGVPYLVQTAGMLHPRALRQKAWKKSLAWRFHFRGLLQAAAALHATAGTEAEHLRALGLRPPVAVVPNGIVVGGAVDRAGARAALDDERPELRGRRLLLCLSRLHAQKGIPELVEAWASVVRSGDAGGWHLLVAGPDAGGHRAELEAIVARGGAAHAVSFLGPLAGDRTTGVMAACDAFVLPSPSESFGMVVAEALAVGLPVVATRGAPWSHLVEHRCGWWVDPGRKALAAALRVVVLSEDVERASMGERGRRFVERELAVSVTAAALVDVYRWLLGRGERPPAVSEAATA